MANEYFIMAKDYRIETAKILEPIVQFGYARKMFPHLPVLKPHTRQTRVWTEVDDVNFEYKMTPVSNRSEMGLTYTDLDTPVFTWGMSYPYDELQMVNDGLLPVDQRIAKMAKYFARSEDIVALGGWTAALGKLAVGPSDTTNSTTAAGTEFNVTTAALAYSTFELMVGQLIDNLGEIGQDPLILSMTPDVYKKARSINQTNSDVSIIAELKRRLQEINPGSQLISTPYLGCTPAQNARKKSYTAGTTNAMLHVWNEDYVRVEHSIIEPRTDGVSKRKGLVIDWVERYRLIFRLQGASIYSGTAVIA